MVTTDQVAGKAKETIGQAEAGLGKMTGDADTQASGYARQAAGTAQNLYGQAKDTIGQAKDSLNDTFGDTLSDAGASAERALHSIESEVKARPLIALLIAALIGYVFAQLTTR